MDNRELNLSILKGKKFKQYVDKTFKRERIKEDFYKRTIGIIYYVTETKE